MAVIASCSVIAIYDLFEIGCNQKITGLLIRFLISAQATTFVWSDLSAMSQRCIELAPERSAHYRIRILDFMTLDGAGNGNLVFPYSLKTLVAVRSSNRLQSFVSHAGSRK